MKQTTYDDKSCMSFASVFRILLSVLIISCLVVYAFAQNTNRIEERQHGQILRIRNQAPLQKQIRQPIQRSSALNAPNQTPPIPTPSIGPIRTRLQPSHAPAPPPKPTFPIRTPQIGPVHTQPIQAQSPIPPPNSPAHIRTPDPSITPSVKKITPPSSPPSPEKIPEVSPRPIQAFKAQEPASKPLQPRPNLVAHREVAPDSTTARQRVRVKNPLQVESLPSEIPVPKEAYIRRAEELPKYKIEQKPEEGIPPQQTPPRLVYREPQPQEGIPPQQTPPKQVREEQSPEDAPFKNPTLLTKKEENKPEMLPTEDVPEEETAVVVEEEPAVEETEVRTTWSIASVEDKHPPREKKEKTIEDAPKPPITAEPKAATVALPKKEPRIKNSLTRGAFIQLASYKKQGDATNAVASQKFPAGFDNVFVYKLPSSQYYKLVAGPFKKDDIGVQLLSLNRKGFADAFVIKKH